MSDQKNIDRLAAARAGRARMPAAASATEEKLTNGATVCRDIPPGTGWRLSSAGINQRKPKDTP